MNPTLREIVSVIENFANPGWQENYDNTGWQILLPDVIDEPCTGMMVCVDATTEILQEAALKGCNFLLTHHPLLFRGIKRIDSTGRVGSCIIDAIRWGISIYSCHTAVDSAPCGVSRVLGQLLGLKDVEVLSPGHEEGTGIGIVGNLHEPLPLKQIISKIKETFHSPVARCSGVADQSAIIHRIAIGGGACGDLIPAAIEKGAQVMVTSDVKHNLFIDYCDAIAVVDIGHYETEDCTKDIFYNIIMEKFPNFVPYYSEKEKNPITYL